MFSAHSVMEGAMWGYHRGHGGHGEGGREKNLLRFFPSDEHIQAQYGHFRRDSGAGFDAGGRRAFAGEPHRGSPTACAMR